ncbi:Reverse transcriptase (RNA-dependent DNA polymerase) [Pristimantis euphronides]
MTQEAVGFEHVKDVPIVNPDFELFVGASQYQADDGRFYTGYAVVTQHEVVIAKPLPPHLSAQEAELKALTETCKVAEGKTANIYTDSRYAFAIAHHWGSMWRARAFLTSRCKPIKNVDSVRHLMDALQLPTRLRVIKVKAHTKADTPKARGNARADTAAKAAAKWPTGKDTVSIQAVSLADPITPVVLVSTEPSLSW